ncbi:hypothetical protein M5E87_18550 [Flavonifractor plautii]|nr:hypothetical protein M5E87_18550 [Flavonifractor plautii]
MGKGDRLLTQLFVVIAPTFFPSDNAILNEKPGKYEAGFCGGTCWSKRGLCGIINSRNRIH